LLTLGCGSWLLLAGCHRDTAVSSEKRSGQSEPRATKEAVRTALPENRNLEPPDTERATREQQEFEKRKRALALLGEVQAETVEETVRNLLYKTYFLLSPFRSTVMKPDDMVREADRNPRVQKLLRIAHEGTGAQRRDLHDAILKMINVYMTELPDFLPEGVRWEPSVIDPGGGIAYFYLLNHLDVDPAGTLKLLVDVHRREQAAYLHYDESRRQPGRQKWPEGVVLTDHGQFLAMTAEQLLTTLNSRADLQKDLTQPQLDVLHEFEQQDQTIRSKRYDALLILKDATEFVYPAAGRGSSQPPKPPASQPATRPAAKTGEPVAPWPLYGPLQLPPALEKLRDLETFIKHRWPNGEPLYGQSREFVSADSVPRLHAMLRDPAWAAHCGTIAYVIGHISKDEASIPVILDYVQRKEDLSGLDPVQALIRVAPKWRVIRWLGRIGGPEATRALRAAFTKEGSRRLAETWANNPKLSVGWTEGTAAAGGLIAEEAAVGLVLTRDPDNIRIVKREYQDGMSLPRPATCSLEAVVLNGLIEERGLDNMLNILGTEEGSELTRPILIEHLKQLKKDLDRQPLISTQPAAATRSTGPPPSASQSATRPSGDARATRPAAKTGEPVAPWPAYGPLQRPPASEKLRDLETFIKYPWRNGEPLYGQSREFVTADSVPRLHMMLKDPAWASHWPTVAFVIGHISEDKASVPVLLDYIRRPEDPAMIKTREEVYARIAPKHRVLAWLGRIGGDEATTALRAALTRPGAKELVRAYESDPKVQMAWKGDHLASIVRETASLGLIYTQTPENIALVEECYRRAIEAPTPYCFGAYSLSLNRVVKERGLDKVLLMDGGERMQLIEPFYKEYVAPVSSR
jgi:hypothetical protein